MTQLAFDFATPTPPRRAQAVMHAALRGLPRTTCYSDIPDDLSALWERYVSGELGP